MRQLAIILLERIQNLGDLGTEVKVRPGYARNYLIPKGKAVPATKENKEKFEIRRQELRAGEEQRLGDAKTRAQALEGLSLKLEAKASAEGRLFGSVSVIDICAAAKVAGFEVSRSEVVLPEGPIKQVGEHKASIILHPEVHLEIAVSVTGEIVPGSGPTGSPEPEDDATEEAPAAD